MKFSSNRVAVADTFSKQFKFRDIRKNDKNGPKRPQKNEKIRIFLRSFVNFSFFCVLFRKRDTRSILDECNTVFVREFSYLGVPVNSLYVLANCLDLITRSILPYDHGFYIIEDKSRKSRQCCHQRMKMVINFLFSHRKQNS